MTITDIKGIQLRFLTHSGNKNVRADTLSRLPQITGNHVEELDATISNKSFYQECFTQNSVLPLIEYVWMTKEKLKVEDLQENFKPGRVREH